MGFSTPALTKAILIGLQTWEPNSLNFNRIHRWTAIPHFGWPPWLFSSACRWFCLFYTSLWEPLRWVGIAVLRYFGDRICGSCCATPCYWWFVSPLAPLFSARFAPFYWNAIVFGGSHFFKWRWRCLCVFLPSSVVSLGLAWLFASKAFGARSALWL